jgi:AcrR family transcriptional regulator
VKEMLATATTKPRVTRAPKGERTRESILRVAVNLASVEGLQGLTIGRLADELKMSKSGLFAHFGSKEDLQLATIGMAAEIFTEHIIRPALELPQGVPRMWQLFSNFLDYVEGKVFQGGCFFAAASFEYDSRPGPVRDAIVRSMKGWMGVLVRSVEGAVQAKHLKESVDAQQFAFEIYSLTIGAHSGFQLLDNKQALSQVRITIHDRILSLATPRCPAINLNPAKPDLSKVLFSKVDPTKIKRAKTKPAKNLSSKIK